MYMRTMMMTLWDVYLIIFNSETFSIKENSPYHSFGTGFVSEPKQNKMARITETFTIVAANKTVKVVNDGIKKFEEQDKEALPLLIETITRSIQVDKLVEGFIPYANFESSVTWVVTGTMTPIDKPPPVAPVKPTIKMDPEELKRLLTKEEITLIEVLDTVIEINGIIGVGLISLGDELSEYCRKKIGPSPY